MKALAVLLGCGLLFGWGLGESGLAKQEVVLSFLELRDLGLLLTMGAALLVSAPVYQIAPRVLARPPLGSSFDRFPRRVTSPNVVGGAIFGLGWGLSGLCPGSALASLGLGNLPVLAGLAGMLLGAYVQGLVGERYATAQPTG